MILQVPSPAQQAPGGDGGQGFGLQFVPWPKKIICGARHSCANFAEQLPLPSQHAPPV
jgi:hypothetical protein